MIRELPSIRWPEPIKSDPVERDHSKKCAYHKDHRHTTERCRSLQYLVEKLLKVGHLKQYVRTGGKSRESSYNQGPRAPSAPVKAIINYIHGEPLDEEYNSKRKDRDCYEPLRLGSISVPFGPV